MTLEGFLGRFPFLYIFFGQGRAYCTGYLNGLRLPVVGISQWAVGHPSGEYRKVEEKPCFG